MFEVYGAAQSAGKKQSNVDWDAYHQYIIDTANLENREVMQGVITFMADLGVQAQPDAEFVFTGDEDEEAAEIEKNPGTYFKTQLNQETKKMARYKCYPQKPIQAVAIAVDFPEIQLDYGQFFGDDSGTTKPLRLWLGGTFYQEGTGMIVARPTYLKSNKKLGTWSFDQKSVPYQIAVAAKVIKPGEAFDTKRIGEILGKTVNWTVQVYNKEGKGGKSYFTEYIKFASGLSRGQKEIEYEGKLHVTGFNRDNDEDSLKELRNHIRNTMKNASNYEGSKIQKQLEALYDSNQKDTPQDEDHDAADDGEGGTVVVPEKAKAKTLPKKVVKPPVETDLDDQDPF